MPDDAQFSVNTAPVLAVLVCHNGEPWLPEVLESLREQTLRPQYVLAVDNGSLDETPEILTEPLGEDVLDGVITLDSNTGFAAALTIAVNTAKQRWGDPGGWIWVLHDDSAPEPDCLQQLLGAAESGRSVGVVGALALDWTDPRLVVEGAVSVDSSGHRQTGLTLDELDWMRFAAGSGEARRFSGRSEVLAVGSAGSLINRELWEALGGYDVDVPLFNDDLDFGWRTNMAGQAVLFVPGARVRHARAATLRMRDAEALGGTDIFTANRAHGLRAFLANCGRGSYLLGVPRLLLLCLLRALGFALIRRFDDAGTELRAFGYLLRGRAGLGPARKDRKATQRGGTAAGLGTSRWTRLRNLVRRSAAAMERRRIVRDSVRGKLPALQETRTIGPEFELEVFRVETDAQAPASAVGLRRAARTLVFALPEPEQRPEPEQPTAAEPAGQAPEEPAAEQLADDEPTTVQPAAAPQTEVVATVDADADAAPAEKSSVDEDPGTAEAPAEQTAVLEQAQSTEDASAAAASTGETEAVKPQQAPPPRRIRRPRWYPALRTVHVDDPSTSESELMVIRLPKRRVLADVLLAPPAVLVVLLALISLLTNADRLGIDLSGGRLLPLPDLGSIWSSYLAAWQPVGGGSAAPAPAALAVLGLLGAPLAPLGGPAAAAALLLFAAAPLAGLFAYLITRRLPVNRWIRALAAAGYALLPPAVAAVAQGRLDAVVVHILLPLVLAGVFSVLTMRRTQSAGTAWLSGAVITSVGLAMIGAFAPLVHLLLLVLALVGFVLLPAGRGAAKRRIAALFAVVLLPLALLLPWPAVLLVEPAVVLHGVGAFTVEQRGTVLDLFGLMPGGPATLPYLGVALVLVALLAVLLRWRSAALPGLGVVLLGAVATAVVYGVAAEPVTGVGPQHGWVGTPLIVVGAGLLWTILGTFEARDAARSPMIARAVGGLGVLTVLAFGVSSLFVGGQGPLRAGGGAQLAAEQTAELADRQTGVLVLPTEEEPVMRQAAGRMPQFGDDDVPRPAGTEQRLAKWALDLRSSNPDVARGAVAAAATSGVRYLVLPDPAVAAQLSSTVGELLSDAGSTSDNRPIRRVEATGGSATLIAPEQSRLAVGGQGPPAEVRAQGIVGVDAAPPDVAVRVTQGAAGRLLVVAANDEPSWQAEVNGQPAPTTRAWGHLVSVAVPTGEAEVRIFSPSLLRNALLLVQLAAALFALFTAIPGRRRPI